jgi:hypothetical protein
MTRVSLLSMVSLGLVCGLASWRSAEGRPPVRRGQRGIVVIAAPPGAAAGYVVAGPAAVVPVPLEQADPSRPAAKLLPTTWDERAMLIPTNPSSRTLVVRQALHATGASAAPERVGSTTPVRMPHATRR